MRTKLTTRVTALFCAVALLAGLCTGAAAEESAAVPALTAGTVSGYTGNTVTLTVKGTDFDTMAALSFMLTYDSNALSISSATASTAMLATVNTASPGIVQYSGISADGVSGTNTLLTIRFTISAEAEARTYPINLLVTNAASGENNTAVTVSTVAGSVTVRESTSSTPTVSFSQSISSSTITAGEDVIYTISSYTLQGMAAGQFRFTYDSDLLEYKNLELLSSMTKGEYIHTVNTNNPGQVVMSYTNTQAVSTGNLMRLTLTAKETASGSTTIGFAPVQLANVEGNGLGFITLSRSFTIKEKVETPVYPKVWIEMPETAATNGTVTAELWVEGSSGLAAADFTVAYDTKQLACTEVTSAISSDEDGSTDGGVVVINDDWANGAIRFSMMNSAGIGEDTKLVTMTFRPVQNAEMNAALTSSVTKPVDKNVGGITLECEAAQVAFFVPCFTVTFYDWDETVLSTQSVPYLSAAAAPAVPDVNGRPANDEQHYVFSGWDKAFTQVESNLDVTVIYQAEDHGFCPWGKLDEEIHTRTCVVCGTSEQGGHDFSKWSKEDETNHTRTCSDCGATQQGSHDFSKWSKEDEENHTRMCSDCGATQQDGHDFSKWSKEDEENHTRTCSDCGAAQRGDHNFSVWSKEDEENHTRACSDCGATQQDGHDFSKWSKEDEENHTRTCSDCGAAQRGDHNFSVWSKEDEENHTRACSDCGATQQEGHDFSKWSKEDEVNHTRTCHDCGATQQGSHDFSKWSKEDEENHTRTCLDCGATQRGDHNFSVWSKEDEENHTRTCSDCGATQRGAHAWDNGDCALCDCSGITIEIATGVLSVKIPGAQSDCRIVIGCYGAGGQQLTVLLHEQTTQKDFSLNVEAPEGIVAAKVFFLNSDWSPVGTSATKTW